MLASFISISVVPNLGEGQVREASRILLQAERTIYSTSLASFTGLSQVIMTALIPNDKDHVQPRGNGYTIPGKGSGLSGVRNGIILKHFVPIATQKIRVVAALKNNVELMAKTRRLII